MIQLRVHIGSSIACVGGMLAVLSFLFVPWFSLGLLGSYTLLQTTQFTSQELHVTLLPDLLWLELLWPAGCVLLAINAIRKKEIEYGERHFN